MVKSRSFWEQHVHACDAGAATVRQYCSDHGLAYASFQYWRRKLRKESRPSFIKIEPAPEESGHFMDLSRISKDKLCLMLKALCQA